MQDEPRPNRARLDGHKCTFYPVKARKAYCLLSSGGMTNRSPFQPDFSPTSWYKTQWRPFLPSLLHSANVQTPPRNHTHNVKTHIRPSPPPRIHGNHTTHPPTHRPVPPLRREPTHRPTQVPDVPQGGRMGSRDAVAYCVSVPIAPCRGGGEAGGD